MQQLREPKLREPSVRRYSKPNTAFDIAWDVKPVPQNLSPETAGMLAGQFQFIMRSALTHLFRDHPDKELVREVTNPDNPRLVEQEALRVQGKQKDDAGVYARYLYTEFVDHHHHGIGNRMRIVGVSKAMFEEERLLQRKQPRARVGAGFVHAAWQDQGIGASLLHAETYFYPEDAHTVAYAYVRRDRASYIPKQYGDALAKDSVAPDIPSDISKQGVMAGVLMGIGFRRQAMAEIPRFGGVLPRVVLLGPSIAEFRRRLEARHPWLADSEAVSVDNSATVPHTRS